MQRLANPLRFRRLSSALLPWTGAAAVLLLAAGTWLSLAGSPRDYQQGETVRIMYVHVPAAWMALFVYTVMALASAVAASTGISKVVLAVLEVVSVINVTARQTSTISA